MLNHEFIVLGFLKDFWTDFEIEQEPVALKLQKVTIFLQAVLNAF